MNTVSHRSFKIFRAFMQMVDRGLVEEAIATRERGSNLEAKDAQYQS